MPDKCDVSTLTCAEFNQKNQETPTLISQCSGDTDFFKKYNTCIAKDEIKDRLDDGKIKINLLITSGQELINKQNTESTQKNLKGVYDKHILNSNKNIENMDNTLSKMFMQHADNLYRLNKYKETVRFLKFTIIFISVVLFIYSLIDNPNTSTLTDKIKSKINNNNPTNSNNSLTGGSTEQPPTPPADMLKYMLIGGSVIIYFLILTTTLRKNFGRKSYDWDKYYWGQPHKVDCTDPKYKDTDKCKPSGSAVALPKNYTFVDDNYQVYKKGGLMTQYPSPKPRPRSYSENLEIDEDARKECSTLPWKIKADSALIPGGQCIIKLNSNDPKKDRPFCPKKIEETSTTTTNNVRTTSTKEKAYPNNIPSVGDYIYCDKLIEDISTNSFNPETVQDVLPTSTGDGIPDVMN